MTEIQQRSSKYQSCRHFNGIQNDCCKAGVPYKSVTLGHITKGEKQGFPCLGPTGSHNRDGATCEKFEPFTRAELEAQRKEMERMMDNVFMAIEAIVKHTGGRYKRGDNLKSGAIDCPVCGVASSLRYRQVGYNGHLHFACGSQGCVKGME